MNKIILIAFGALIILAEMNKKERVKENVNVRVENSYKLTKADAG